MSLVSLKNRIGSDNYDTIQTFLTRLFAFGISLFFKIVIARFLTVEENGIFGKWLASYNYGIIAFSFGLNLSMIYFSRDSKSILYSFVNNIILYGVFLVLFFSIGFYVQDRFYFHTLVIAVFFGLVLSNLNSVQLSLNKISVFNLTEIAKNFLILSICLFPVLFLNYKSLNLLFVLYTSSLGITLIAFMFTLDLFELKINRFSVPRLDYIKYGLQGTVLNVLGQSVYIVDVFLVSYIAGNRYLGLYVVGSSIARLLWFFVDAAGTVMFPKLVQSKDNESSRNVIYNLSSFSFLISLIGLAIFYFVGERIISLTFGEEYNESFMTIIVLMLASPGMIFYKLINRYLASNNEWRLSYVSIGVTLILNVLLNLILINYFNIIGAAVSSLISYWFCGILIAKMAEFDIFKLMFSKSVLRS